MLAFLFLISYIIIHFQGQRNGKVKKHKLKCTENFDIELHYTFITNIQYVSY